MITSLADTLRSAIDGPAPAAEPVAKAISLRSLFAGLNPPQAQAAPAAAPAVSAPTAVSATTSTAPSLLSGVVAPLSTPSTIPGVPGGSRVATPVPLADVATPAVADTVPASSIVSSAPLAASTPAPQTTPRVLTQQPIAPEGPSDLDTGLSYGKTATKLGGKTSSLVASGANDIPDDMAAELIKAGVPKSATSSYQSLLDYSASPQSLDTATLEQITGQSLQDLKDRVDVSSGLAETGRYLGATTSLLNMATTIAGDAPDVVKGLSTAKDLGGAFTSLSGTELGAATGLKSLADTAIPGLAGSEGALGGAFGTVGQAAGAVGAVAGLGMGAYELAEGDTLIGAIDTAASAATLAMMAGTVTAPFAWIPAVLGAAAHLAVTLFGDDDMSHAEREELEYKRTANEAQGLAADIRESWTTDDLYNNLVTWQSGYVGGTSKLAVAVGAQRTMSAADAQALVTAGDLTLPQGQTFEQVYGVNPATDGDRQITVSATVGRANPNYAVWNADGFFKEIGTTPDSLFVKTQAGVTQDTLDQLNDPVRKMILGRASTMTKLAPVVDLINTRMPQGEAISAADIYKAAPLAKAAGVSYTDPAFVDYITAARDARTEDARARQAQADAVEAEAAWWRANPGGVPDSGGGGVQDGGG